MDEFKQSKNDEGLTADGPAFSEGDRVEYAEGKVGIVIGLVPAPPETDDPYVEGLWKELINRAAMDEYEGIALADDEPADPRYVVRRETGVTTAFEAEELVLESDEDERHEKSGDDTDSSQERVFEVYEYDGAERIGTLARVEGGAVVETAEGVDPEMFELSGADEKILLRRFNGPRYVAFEIDSTPRKGTSHRGDRTIDDDGNQ